MGSLRDLVPKGRPASALASVDAPDLAVDLRTVPVNLMTSEVVETFRLLPAGRHFVLLSDHSPLPLLHHLVRMLGEQVSWNVLEDGPATFRFEVVKWAGEGPRDVTTFLEVDHDRLDALLEEALALAREGDERALQRYRWFRVGLERHIRMEEEILFPAFEERTGMGSGPTSVMRAEHATLRMLLASSEAAFARGGDVSEAAAALVQAVGGHNQKEEKVLYPMTDQLLAGPEALAMVRQMHGV